MDLSHLIEALRSPSAYPRPAREVEVLHTHISVLFFVGDLVYKLKKPVDLGFLDFRTLEDRRHACAEEVRLNADLAPGVYRRVVEIRCAGDGAVRVEGEGETVDAAVEMVRLPAARMLDRLLADGEPDGATLGRLASVLATFHTRCATGRGVDEHAAPERVQERIVMNLGRLEAVSGPRPSREDASAPVLTEGRLTQLRAWVDGEVERRGTLMLERMAAGRVREGHGDLHAGNICLMADGPVIYDRIEFNRAFRCLDVAAELAFLGMDLDLHGRPAPADAIVERYASITGDRTIGAMQPLYRLHYAVVRAMVEALRAREGEIPGDERLAAWRSARAHADLAAGYAAGACLVVMCGLPGTGKSHLARAIATPLRARVHRSDAIRKALLGAAPTHRLSAGDDEGAYASGVSARVYEQALHRAGEDLLNGRSAVLDATFASRAHREAAVAVAEARGASWVLVEATAPEDVVRARLRARARDASEVSDADFGVYLAVRDRFERPDEVPERRHVVATHETPASLVVGEVIDRVL